MAKIVATRLVEHIERASFVIMKRTAIGGGAALPKTGNSGDTTVLTFFRLEAVK